MKPLLVFPAPKALETPKAVLESQPTVDFLKPLFIIKMAVFIIWWIWELSLHHSLKSA
jgi:hypothetical protein